MTPSAQALGARSLPRGLATIVEALETEQAHLVTASQLESLRLALGVASPAKVLAARLREHGWLLRTPRRGVYEFAPAAHGGALSRGDATLPLQAVLAARPDLVAGLTLQSAAWALDIATRLPQRLEVTTTSRSEARSLSRVLGADARVLVFEPRLDFEHHRGVPVLSADSLCVHMATSPRDVRSWSSALEWLPDVAAELTGDRLAIELTDRPAAVAARLAYLLSGLRPDIAANLPRASSGKVYFGPHGKLRRHDQGRQIADTLLPFDPRTLDAVK